MESVRQLVRIESFDNVKAVVIIPGWDHEQPVTISLSTIPSGVRNVFAKGKRLHARINFKAEKAEDLVFSNWETT